MAKGRRTLAVLVGGLLVLASGAIAQVGLQEEHALMLTPEAPSDQQAPSGPPCGQLALYGLARPGQVPQETEKAYTSPSSAALGCPTLFRTQTPGAFNLTQDARVQLFFGCEEPTFMHEPLNNVRVWLVHEGQILTEAGGQIGPLCTPGDPMELELTIDAPEDTSFQAGDSVGINVTAFGSPNLLVQNLHVLVGGEDTASSLTLPGLADAYQPEDPGTNESQDETDPFGNDTELEPTAGEEANGTPGPGVAAVGVLGVAAWLGRRRD